MTPPAPLWTLDELVAATGGKDQGDFSVRGISIDTRSLQAGDLFIALKGPNFDGHDYIDQAMAAGAAGILTAQQISAPHIRVTDTQQALTDLGRAARARHSRPLIAITGSVGKTTTRALTAAAWGSFARVHATQGNLNNHLGVPLTLARMPRDAEVAILEMGMNHFGEIAHLSRIAQPTHALITAIDWVHSENLDGTLAGVAKAKAEICAGLSGPLFIPQPYADLLAPHIKGQDVHWVDRPYAGPLNLPGEENAWNAALAMATIPPDHREAARQSLAQVDPEPGRGTHQDVRVDGRTIRLIDEAYNAAPASMRAAVTNLVQTVGSRKIAIVGDMAELANPEGHHKTLGAFLAAQPLDLVIAVGRHRHHILAPLPDHIKTVSLATAAEVVSQIRPLLADKDTVLIKASNSTGLGQVVRDLHALGPA